MVSIRALPVTTGRGPADGMTLSVVVAKRLSPQFALDVAFSAPPGITILFGASGSGKTTVLRAVAGLARPDRGRIAVGNHTLFDRATGVDLPVPQRRVGYVFQQLALFPHMSIADNIQYGLHGLPVHQRQERMSAIADSFRITHVLQRRPGQTSGGERQRAALARALVTDPTLLLLDEPLSGLDQPIESRIIEDLRRWNEAHRIPVLYVTHAHREVFALGERVIVLEGGRVLASGSPHEVLEQPSHESLASLVGFENVFDGIVMDRRTAAGTMTCRISTDHAELEVPLSTAPVGSTVRIAIRAGDILVANEEPRGLSARNILGGRLLELRREGATMIASIDAGQRFIVHLTPGACDALGLVAGVRLWLIIKTCCVPHRRRVIRFEPTSNRCHGPSNRTRRRRAAGHRVLTLKQWIYRGVVRTTTTSGGHHRIADSEIDRLIAKTSSPSSGAERKRRVSSGYIVALSGRNRLGGFIEEVRVDGLLGQVRLRIGDQTLTAVITADAIRELKLRRGDEAIAIIKSTEVMIAREAELPVAPRRGRPRR